jgi:hypothetical protein
MDPNNDIPILVRMPVVLVPVKTRSSTCGFCMLSFLYMIMYGGCSAMAVVSTGIVVGPPDKVMIVAAVFIMLTPLYTMVLSLKMYFRKYRPSGEIKVGMICWITCALIGQLIMGIYGSIMTTIRFVDMFYGMSVAFMTSFTLAISVYPLSK